MNTSTKQISNKPLISLIIVCTMMLSACTHVPDNSRMIANSKLDQIIDEFKAHYDADISVDRKMEIATVQENLLKFLIEASNRDEVYKLKVYNEATEYFNKIYPVILDNIRKEKAGTGSFIAVKKAPLWTLRDELDFLLADVKQLSPPTVKIELMEGMKMITPLYRSMPAENRTKIHGRYDQAVAKIFGQDLQLLPSFSELDNLVDSDGDDKSKILKAISLVESKLSKHEQKIRNIGSEIAKSGRIDLKNTQIRLVVRFMDYYFNKLQPEVVKTIMSELVSGGPKLPEEEVMKIVFKNTGPGLGKVLQQIGKEQGMSEHFSKLMGILESSGKEVPFHLVERIVNNDKGGFEIKNLEAKPLGTGTIAQVNRAEMWNQNIEKEVAVRFLKPGVEARCKEDIKILRQFVPDNEALFAQEGVEDIKVISTLIDSVEKFLDEEVNLKIAVSRQKKAYEVYNRSVKVSANPDFDLLEMRVPEVYESPTNTTNLHIQEFATGGVKFSELSSDGSTKKIVAQEMIRMWFEEALFKSGFLNADLHQGNFRVVLIEENKKIKILLYDFGLSSTLTKEDQRAFLLLGAGAYLKSPRTITDGLMVSMQSTDAELRKKLMKDIQAEMIRSPNKKPEDWVVWCVQKSYFVSDKLGAFARGSLLLKQLPESMGETEMFKETIVKSALRNLTDSIADRNYKYPLKKIDLIKIAGIQMVNTCRDLIKSFWSR